MAVEFALVAPMFLASAYALFQAGFAVYSHATISQAAEQGARQLMFAPDDDQAARQAVLSAVSGTALDPTRLTISIQSIDTPYPHMALTVDYLFQAAGPFPLPQEIPLTAVVLVPTAQD